MPPPRHFKSTIRHWPSTTDRIHGATRITPLQTVVRVQSALVDQSSLFGDGTCRKLLLPIEEGNLDTTFLVFHHASLEDAAEMYRHSHEQNDYTKIVLKTDMAKGSVKSAGAEAVPA